MPRPYTLWIHLWCKLMNRVLKVVVFAVGVLVCGQAVQADDKTHKAAAKELLKAMDAEAQYTSAIDTQVDQLAKANPMFAEKKDALKKFFTKYMGYESMEDDLVKMYTKNFTEAELKEITTFYKTPAGKKLASKTAEISKLGMELGMKKVQENQAELIKLLTGQ